LILLHLFFYYIAACVLISENMFHDFLYQELGPDECVRVKTVDLDGKPQVQTLKQDLHYWPTWELRFDPDTAMWRKNTINALDCGNG
jgi:hypothetical protein